MHLLTRSTSTGKLNTVSFCCFMLCKVEVGTLSIRGFRSVLLFGMFYRRWWVGEEQAKVLFLQELITFVTEEEDVAVKSLAGGRNESQDDGKLTIKVS